MPIKNWSTTPADNNDPPPNGWPEGQAPSTVNDCARQGMADIRSQCQDMEWFDWGDSGLSRASATTFKITGDVTSRYTVNRAIKCSDASSGAALTLYGIITASSYSAPDTTVTVNLDSGSLTASLTSVGLAILSPTNRAIPTALGRKGTDVASSATINLSTAAGDFVDVTGTTTITALTSEVAGIWRVIRFTGALTLTHNATSLILPGAANITTANGDVAAFRSLGSGNWQCVSYMRGAGFPATLTGTETLTNKTLSGAVITGAGPATPNITTLYTNNIPKFWVNYGFPAGTPTVNLSYNVSSLTDNGTGDVTINLATAVEGAGSAIAGMAEGNNVVRESTKTTSAIRVITITNTADTAVDASSSVIGFSG